MILPKVFIVSSSEGLNVVNKICPLLQKPLEGKVIISPWPGEFKQTMTYIESLERLLDTSDFAVMLLTPDDITVSRGTETTSPRDNVMFELGLFFGRLGRERCFIIQQNGIGPDYFGLKLPSDLLGIKLASFSISQDQDLENSLEQACTQIEKAICSAMNNLPSRPKLDDSGQTIQAAMRKFADQIVGTWWERILIQQKPHALSFFTIEQDDLHNSVRFVGKAYDSNGDLVANWKSAAVRLDRKKIVYVRECQRFDTTTVWRPGLGEFELDFNDLTDVIKKGDGKFWESDETRPEETVIKLVQLKRNNDNKDTLTMQEGSEKEKKKLVQKIFKAW